MIKRIALYISLLLLTSLAASAAESAADVIKKASDLLSASSGTTASFRMASDADGSMPGTIAMSGTKFNVATTQNTTIFDGATQWTIDPQTMEVSIYDPTPEELQQINPLGFIKGAAQNFTPKLVSSAGGNIKVQLTPKIKDSQIKKATITFSAATGLPSSIAMTLSDGTSLNIAISNLKLNQQIPSSKFKVGTKDYPGYDFVDLR